MVVLIATILWKFHMISIFHAEAASTQSTTPSGPFLSTDKNGHKIFQMTIFDLKHPTN